MHKLVFPLLFALTTVAIWLPIKFTYFGRPVFLWQIGFVLMLTIGWYYGFLEWSALIFIVIYFSLFLAYRAYEQSVWAGRVLLFGIVLMSLLLGFHVLPGFNALPIIDESVLSSASLPYSNRFNLDKYLVGIAVMAFIHPSIWRMDDWKSAAIASLRAVAAAAVIVFPLGLLLGVLAIDVKVPKFLPIWIMSNLIFTCVTEEAFFRGLLQRKLQSVCENIKHGHYVAMTLVAVFFGIVHFGFGLNYIVLATIAGFVYGWVYYRTGKIEAAILTHFGVNLIHIIFFTYPLK